MKKTTAYLMRSILQDVVRRGSGGGAYFSGMSIGGKTGTTDDARDRYFAGFTPYYCAAAWVDINLMRWCIPIPTHVRLCSRES